MFDVTGAAGSTFGRHGMEIEAWGALPRGASCLTARWTVSCGRWTGLAIARSRILRSE